MEQDTTTYEPPEDAHWAHETMEDEEHEVLTPEVLPAIRQHAPLIAAASPEEMVDKATAIAATLQHRVIEANKLYAMIRNRKHVYVEGWVTLGAMLGVTPHEIDTRQRADGSFRSIIELRRIADGVTISRASAECGGPEEQDWQDRPPYARRSMAQTRATGKACRLALSWIMVLAGYSGTPAEEMEREALPPCPACGAQPFDNRTPRAKEPEWVTKARAAGTLPDFRCRDCKHEWSVEADDAADQRDAQDPSPDLSLLNAKVGGKGKHKDETWSDVLKSDPSYVAYMLGKGKDPKLRIRNAKLAAALDLALAKVNEQPSEKPPADKNPMTQSQRDWIVGALDTKWFDSSLEAHRVMKDWCKAVVKGTIEPSEAAANEAILKIAKLEERADVEAATGVTPEDEEQAGEADDDLPY